MTSLAPFQTIEPVDEEEQEDEEWSCSSLPPRRRGRALAFQALFELDATRHNADDVLGALLEGSDLGASREEFTRGLVAGVQEHSKDLDAQIQRFAPAWPVEQLSLVDRCLLRLAVYELTVEHDTSPKVVINEAVELAKLFGGESSPRFINGVLGSLHDAMQGEPKG
ncbi:MAG: transcription antitermination factor NusB [Chloroflexota bacterium]|nr:transcription antitermination factor NusB [Chloroflexota bacterium]